MARAPGSSTPTPANLAAPAATAAAVAAAAAAAAAAALDGSHEEADLGLGLSGLAGLNATNASLFNGTWLLDPEFGRDDLVIIMPLSVLYVVIFVFGLLGNVSTCIVISRNRQMRTATNYYLFSLACSDLLLLISGLPLELHKIWFPYPYPFNEAVCIIQGLAAETSANATVLTILLFTCERYVGICHPLAKHQTRRRCGALHSFFKAPVLLAFVWVLALALAVPQAMQFGIISSGPSGAPDMSECTLKRALVAHAFLISSVLFFISPLSVITVLYVRIALKLHRTKKAAIRSTNQQNQGHVFRILVAVVLTFFLCWFPFHAQRLIAVYAAPTNPDDEKSFKIMFNAVTYISGVMYFMSTMINPILYHSMSNKFKEAFWDTIYRDFNGFNCITIPEHWKRKQESRYNLRRGGRSGRSERSGRMDHSRRSDAPPPPPTASPASPPCPSSQPSQPGQSSQPSHTVIELQAMGPTTSAIVLSSKDRSTTYLIDAEKLQASLHSGLSLLPLLRTQSLYGAPPRDLCAPPRRSFTLDTVDEMLRLRRVLALDDPDDPDDPLLPGRSGQPPQQGALGVPQGQHGLASGLASGLAAKRMMHADVDAIEPCPPTPTPPASHPPTPTPPDSPYAPPRVVRMHLKNEVASGWV